MVDWAISPAGKPPPISIILITCSYFRPITIHLLASLMALSRATDDPLTSDPQWKWIPSNLIPSPWISFILYSISSSVSRSSPNLLEKIPNIPSSFLSFIDTLHNIFIFGANDWIFNNSSIVSAVVREMPFCYAHSKSISSLMGLEYTIDSTPSPAPNTFSISSLEAQSIPAPFLTKSNKMGWVGLDFMA